VVYSSGAPVADAKLELAWQINGGWPAPTTWMKEEGGLPRKATTKANGRFKLELPKIPADLQGRVTMSARVVATDPAGDRVEAGTAVLLSEDLIQAQAQTNLGDGLVQGFNNRMYLRVTTADGRALPGAKVNVKRAWIPTDKGLDTTLDEDGVGRVQLDPGPPVSIVIPPQPVRTIPRKKSTIVRYSGIDDHLTGAEPTMKDMVALEQWLAPLERCAKFKTEGDGDNQYLALHVAPSGAIVASMASDNAAARCALGAVRGKRLPPGQARFFTIELAYNDNHLPALEAAAENAIGEADLGSAFVPSQIAARDCLPKAYEGDLDQVFVWQVRKGQKNLTGTWTKAPDSEPTPAAVTACVKRSVRNLTLDEPAEESDMGVAIFSVNAAEVEQEAKANKPRPTIMVGYELLVSVEVNGESQGTTKLRMKPGSVPPLRLRATPVMAKAGEEVHLELIRGPDYSGDVPDYMMWSNDGKSDTFKVDVKTRKATFKLPDDAEGWYEFRADNARSLVYVSGATQLAVSVKPEKNKYAPGEKARLLINTSISGAGASAGVGLFGVDQSLGQLVPLPGPDALSGLRPHANMNQSALGNLDAQALAMGRVRGAHAAEAVIMRVGSIPTPAETDVAVSGSAATLFDPVAETVPRFYAILEELYRQTYAWEKSTKADRKMTPETMVEMWNKALDQIAKDGGETNDAFGRRMRLHRLPDDLLMLADPRQVVSDGGRLPEDVENWVKWVKNRRPK
jgi:hypothetical protein